MLPFSHFSLYIKCLAAKKMDYIHTQQQNIQQVTCHVKLTSVTNLTMLSIHSKGAKFLVSVLVRIWSFISTNIHLSCQQVYIKVIKITPTITKKKLNPITFSLLKLQLGTKITSRRKEQVVQRTTRFHIRHNG